MNVTKQKETPKTLRRIGQSLFGFPEENATFVCIVCGNIKIRQRFTIDGLEKYCPNCKGTSIRKVASTP